MSEKKPTIYPIRMLQNSLLRGLRKLPKNTAPFRLYSDPIGIKIIDTNIRFDVDNHLGLPIGAGCNIDFAASNARDDHCKNSRYPSKSSRETPYWQSKIERMYSPKEYVFDPGETKKPNKWVIVAFVELIGKISYKKGTITDFAAVLAPLSEAKNDNSYDLFGKINPGGDASVNTHPNEFHSIILRAGKTTGTKNRNGHLLWLGDAPVLLFWTHGLETL